MRPIFEKLQLQFHLQHTVSVFYCLLDLVVSRLDLVASRLDLVASSLDSCISYFELIYLTAFFDF